MPLVAEIVELKESHRDIITKMRTRCKFQVTASLPAYPSTDPDSPMKRIVFEPRYDHNLPEDQRFFKATPSGRLDIIVDSPEVISSLMVGDLVYVDITKIE